MAITTASDMATPQILIDAIRGRFRQKNAFMGSLLVSSGAVMVSGSMPKGGPGAIGKTIEIPYFGTLGKFVNNPDGSAVTPQKLAQILESATIARSSLAVETSIWSQGLSQVDPNLGDPYKEGADQAMEQAERRMDELIVTEFATTPLVHDVYSASVPVYLDHRLAVRARTKWGDEQDSIVAMVTHSQAEADLAELTDTSGRPLLVESQREGQEGVRRFAGMPLLVSDSVPLTGSTMGTVTSTGTSPPVATITGTPTGAWDLRIECILGGAHATATIRFSVDGGNTWSATLTTLGVGVALALTDTNVDSLVGNNGTTGLSVAFAAGAFNADNRYSSKANLKVTSLICQAQAGAFWYAADRLGSKTDTDILADADILAMHLYAAPKLYRRRRMGTRPGCIAIKHNVKNFVG
jgi:hypothetical protein